MQAAIHNTQGIPRTCLRESDPEGLQACEASAQEGSAIRATMVVTSQWARSCQRGQHSSCSTDLPAPKQKSYAHSRKKNLLTCITVIQDTPILIEGSGPAHPPFALSHVEDV